MKETKIHFVCTGNTFRSRLAKAYFDYLKINGVKTSSSGIRANKNFDGTICWYTQKLIDENNLIEFVEPTWTQTSPKILSRADYIIFMQTHHLKDCQRDYGYKLTNYEIWEINDMSENKCKDSERIQESRELFEKIKSKVGQLAKKLSK